MLDGNVGIAPEDIRFRLLVPVWGERYIDGFCDIALPALLADGNLPALIAHAECEVIFLTTRDSVEVFETSIGVAKLRKLCLYSFVYIDDLLPFVDYGIILTTAYGRGIAAMGDRQLSTYFVFLNADFVLSNGALRSVVDRIRHGFRAVMAPSLRCVEQKVEAELRKRVSTTTGRLDATSAELVQLTLDHLHPTASASIINKPRVHHTGANQFFWQVDDHTLIGRYFLLFMLCIRPEQLFDNPTGWCDYAFMPDLIPSHNFDVLTDSNDGFILEMQALRGDSHHVRIGQVSPDYYRRRLEFWATANHRRYATSTIVFHSRELPSHFERVKSEADKFMDSLLESLRTPAVSHLDHPFWVSAVRHHQKRLGMHVMPAEFASEITIVPKQFDPEIAPPHLALLKRSLALATASINRFFSYGARRVKDGLIGRAPTVGPLHYAFMDFANFRKQITEFCADHSRILYVKDRDSPIDRYVETSASLNTVTMQRLLGGANLALTDPMDGAIISVTEENIERLPDILLAIGRAGFDSPPVLLCANGVQGAFFHARTSLAGDLAREIATRFDSKISIKRYLMVGCRERLSIDYRVRKSFQLLLAGGFVVHLAVAMVVLSSFLKLLYINATKGPRSSISESDICTSATVTFEGSWRELAGVGIADGRPMKTRELA